MIIQHDNDIDDEREKSSMDLLDNMNSLKIDGLPNITKSRFCAPFSPACACACGSSWSRSTSTLSTMKEMLVLNMMLVLDRVAKTIRCARTPNDMK